MTSRATPTPTPSVQASGAEPFSTQEPPGLVCGIPGEACAPALSLKKRVFTRVDVLAGSSRAWKAH